MNKKLFAQLCINYNKEPNEELYLLWNEELQDYDPYYVEVALKNIIKNEKYFPTLNRVMQEIKDLPCIEIPESIKRKRMKERGVIPSWLNRQIKTVENDEEDEEFKQFIAEFRKI